MRVPIEWLVEFVKIPKDLSKLTDKLTMVGHMLDKTEKIKGDTVIDLELRGNRADMVGILGVAREVGAILNLKVNNLALTKLPPVDSKHPLLTINPEINDLVKRYTAIKLSVNIKPSPKFIIDRLERYGIPVLNNVVDITNYVMVETGHPMHAFDVDKLAGKKLILRMAKAGEKFETIQQGTTLTLTKDDLVISDQHKVQCLNIIGGFDSRVTEETKEIILESAVYDPGNCRRTGRRLKTLTEGGGRHEKLQDPNGVTLALERALYLLEKYADAKITSKTSDYYPSVVNSWKTKLNYEHLNKLGGLKIDKSEIKKILQILGFKIVKESNEELELLVPTYRTDVKLEEDVIEEVLRIYGYDKIPTKTLALEIPKNVTPKYINQEIRLRNEATKVGFSEIISLSFVKEEFNNLNVDSVSLGRKPVVLQNPPSPDNKDMRMNLLPNLYELALKAINQRKEEVRLFEIGKVYSKQNKNYEETRKIGFIYYLKDLGVEKSFKQFKSYMTAFFELINIDSVQYIPDATNLPFTHSYTLKSNNQIVGFGGALAKSVQYLELDLDLLLKIENKQKIALWSKYPPQVEDITLVVPEKTYVGNVVAEIINNQSSIIKAEFVDIYENNYTFNIQYQSEDHTLTDKEVEAIRNKILSSLKSKFGISIKE